MAVLYVVATPIGNLQDLSPRGAETLRNADLIIAEDTRVTMKLCQVFSLKAPLVSCHRHSEDSKATQAKEISEAYARSEAEAKEVLEGFSKESNIPENFSSDFSNGEDSVF